MAVEDPDANPREAEADDPDEVALFFALPRWVLYGCCLLAVANIGALVGLARLLRHYDIWDLWVIPACTGSMLLWELALNLTPAGRGGLRTFGWGFGSGVGEDRFSPRTQVALGWVVFLGSTALTVYHSPFYQSL
jgi:hypothetical protein